MIVVNWSLEAREYLADVLPRIERAIAQGDDQRAETAVAHLLAEMRSSERPRRELDAAALDVLQKGMAMIEIAVLRDNYEMARQKVDEVIAELRSAQERKPPAAFTPVVGRRTDANS